MADAGLKMTVEGEREFKKALSGINEEMKLLGSEMKLVASEFDANDKSVDALSAKYGVMSREVDTQRKKVDTLKDALAAASKEFGENNSKTQSWQRQLNNATAELNNMQRELDKTGESINDAGKNISSFNGDAFEQMLSDINDTMQGLGAEMKVVASEFGAQDKSVDALTAKYRVMSKEVREQRDKVITLEVALEEATKAFGENDKRTKSWQKQLNLATADLNNMQKELRETKDELDAAGKNTSSFGDKLKDSLKKAASELKSFGSGLASVGEKAKKFSDKGLKGLKTAAVAGGAALAGLATAAISAANNVAAAGDQIDKESQKLNMSREAYQEWSYVLSQNGADIAQLGSGMEALVDKMKAAGEGSEEITGMFGELGVSMDALKTATPEKAFEMVVQGLQGMTDETRKAQIAQELLGGSGAELMPLLNSTADATERLKQEAHDLGMVMSDDAVDAAVKYTDSVDKMKRVGTALFQNITSELLPGFTMIADGLVGLATGQEDATSKIKDGVKDIVENIREMLPMVLDVIREVLPLLVTAIVETLPLLIETLTEVGGELATTLVEALKENWPAIKEAGLELVHGLWEGIEGAGAWLWEQLSGWASGIVGDIKDFFGIQSPSKVFAGIGGYLAEGLGVGFEKEMDAVSRQMREAVPTSFDASIDARLRTTAYGADRGAYMERGFARNGYPSQQTIVLQVGEREFGRIVVDASEKEYVRRDMKVVTR